MSRRKLVKQEFIVARILAINKSDPTLSWSIVAQRCGCSADFVVQTLKRAGLYVQRAAGFRGSQS